MSFKKVGFQVAIALLISLLIAGCGGDSSEGDNGNNGADFLTYKGVTYAEDNQNIFVTATNPGTGLLIGMTQSSPYLIVSLKTAGTAAGDYPVDAGNTLVAVTEGGVVWASTAGSISLATSGGAGSRISGTYAVTIRDPNANTQDVSGSFSVIRDY